MFSLFRPLVVSLTFVSLVAANGPRAEQKQAPFPFESQKCPCDAQLSDQATLQLPAGYRFIDRENAPKFLEYTQNIPGGDELGVVFAEDQSFFVIFSFRNVGYVRDDEKSELDADSLLKSISAATEAANEESRKRGWGTMTVVGWHQKPHYEEASHNLEWSIVGQAEDGLKTINHNSRFLGRRGFISANLVSAPGDLKTSLASFRDISAGFEFTPDNHYTAFVKATKLPSTV